MRSMVKDLRPIVRNVLNILAAYDQRMAGETAEYQILRTGAVETSYRHLCQFDNGPALGFFQTEPDTARDIYATFLAPRPDLLALVDAIAGGDAWHGDIEHHLVHNIALQIALCRLKYWRSPGPIPPAQDLNGQAKYWKEHYNTPGGKGTPAQFVSAARQAGLDGYLWQK